MDDFFFRQELKKIKDEFKLLAFIGDAYFNLLVRCLVVGRYGQESAPAMKMCAFLVSSLFQAWLLEQFFEKLLPEEQDLIRRGRNYKHWPKNRYQKRQIYIKASCLECLFGRYLLEEKQNRVSPFMKSIESVLEREPAQIKNLEAFISEHGGNFPIK
ncbi:ribonuclease III domain-containing protein [Candidatus Riflebacteria bacterium]